MSLLHKSSRFYDEDPKQPSQVQIDGWISIGLFAIGIRASELKLTTMKVMGDPGTRRFPRVDAEKSLIERRQMLIDQIDEYLENAQAGKL